MSDFDPTEYAKSLDGEKPYGREETIQRIRDIQVHRDSVNLAAMGAVGDLAHQMGPMLAYKVFLKCWGPPDDLDTDTLLSIFSDLDLLGFSIHQSPVREPALDFARFLVWKRMEIVMDLVLMREEMQT